MGIAEYDSDYKLVRSIPVIPVKPDGLMLGYTTKKPKTIASGGMEFKGFLKPEEFSISKTEATRRQSAFKVHAHNYLLRNIGKQLGNIIDRINPDEIVIERNKSFNGVLTTKLLAEIAGGLYFYAGARNIPLFDYDEATIRAYIRKTITDFSYADANGKESIDTKWEIRCRLKEVFGKLMNFDNVTLDETDALAALYFHIEKGRSS